MNSEELEMSLRSEFEIYLKDVLANMRQEFSQFQEKIEAEFDKHKSQLDTVFQEFSVRFDNENQLDQGFKDTVVEHLRLARDEGARVTATAIAEAEDMQKQSAPTDNLSKPAAPPVSVSQLRDSINDITSQDSQGTILKSLVQNAEKYTPRGAFFIIKNEHFVGWRIFNKEGEADENAVREVYLPVASESVLGESVRSLSAVESSFGTYADDAEYLNSIGFGEPERMIAIPLVARGRGVAVLYADHGTQAGEEVNVEALETLVRVAGLTVEVLAAAAAAAPQPAKHAPTEATPTPNYNETASDDKSVEQMEESQTEESREFAPPETSEVAEPSEIGETSGEAATADESFSPAVQSSESSHEETPQSSIVSQPEEDFSRPEETVSQSEDDQEQEYSGEIIEDAQVISVEPTADEDSPEISDQKATEDSYSPPISTDFRFTESSAAAESPMTNDFADSSFGDKSFEAVNPASAPAEASRSFEKSNGSPVTYTPQPSAGEKVSGAPVRSRFGDRNVDLPIEVSEDERRLHNDARRFARLLVSEIKLYNEQKVKEGREARDLYDRLREAIDRSRDMYNKRVQPPVADKFDYFHYELVSTLAEGEANKLGGDYPGATT